MIEAGKRYKVKVAVPGLADAGTIVRAEEDKEKKGQPVLGLSGLFLCSLDSGGSLFFKESNLELVEQYEPAYLLAYAGQET